MFSRATVLGVLLALPVYAGAAGHTLEVGLHATVMDFDPAFQFDNDTQLGVTGSMGISPSLSVGMDLGYATLRDARRDEWTTSITAGAHLRVEPWNFGRFTAGAMFGVSFFAYEDNVGLDQISEGLDLGPSLRWRVNESWSFRFDHTFRLQTVRLTLVDALGRPIGGSEESDYLWSRFYRLGMSHEF